ncbi:hypothetical protein DESC_320007 [Desulfosarcina cetonica]|nr:hypothetical protein DESC_320007 [Desulfosarcina cetonica]
MVNSFADIRLPEKNNSSILLVFAPVYRVAAPRTYSLICTGGGRRLVDDFKSGAIWGNYLFSATLSVRSSLQADFPNLCLQTVLPGFWSQARTVWKQSHRLSFYPKALFPERTGNQG